MPGYGSLRTNKSRRETLRDIVETFRRWGIELYDAPYERGQSIATVWFNLGGERKTVECRKFYDHAENLRAIYLALEGLRLASQRGILEQYRQFFKELSAPSGQPATRSPYEVLGVSAEAPLEVVEAAYRALAKKAHPDSGGSNERMRELNQALVSVKAERK